MAKTKLSGTVISDKMQKTRVVEVETLKLNVKYQRRYKSHKRFKAHDEKGEYKTGDKVVIEESKPLSRDKHWTIISKA